MLSPAAKSTLAVAIDGVKMKRANDKQAAQQRQQAAIAAVSGKALTGKSKAGAKPKARPKARPKAGAKPKSTITPYLTSSDLMEVSNATSAAENADSSAKFGLANAAANALRATGDIERGRVKAVSGANDDAAARGLYDSGIRAGNVGMANASSARGQQGVRDSLAMSAAQSVAQRNGARQQLGSQLQIMAQRAAENGAALPVSPDPYSSAPRPGANVRGAATLRKIKRKK